MRERVRSALERAHQRLAVVSGETYLDELVGTLGVQARFERSPSTECQDPSSEAGA
jgi:hypothetical protein